MVTYPFYSINRQSIHRIKGMQRIKKILMWEVLPAIALNIRDSALQCIPACVYLGQIFFISCFTGFFFRFRVGGTKKKALKMTS